MSRILIDALNAQVKNIVTRFEKEVKSLLECKLHQIFPAELCDRCGGMTKFGPVEDVRSYLEINKILHIEVVGETSRINRISQKVAFGAGYVSGAVSWIHGKLVLQMVKIKKS